MKYCRECGKQINEKAVICIHCGCATGVNNALVNEITNNKTTNKSNDTTTNNNKVTNKGKDKVVAILLLIFLGTFGAHQFYVGNIKRALLYLATTLILAPLLGIPFIVLLVVLFIDLFDICKGNLNGVELN